MHSAKHSHYTAIIEHPLEHFRVLGPAGSGKTTTLLERYRFLNSKNEDNTHGIVIVTYTKESAAIITRHSKAAVKTLPPGKAIKAG